MNLNNLTHLNIFQSFCQDVLNFVYNKISTKVLSPDPPILIIDTLSKQDNEIAYLDSYIYLVIKLNGIARCMDPLSLYGMANTIHTIAHEIGHGNQVIDFERYKYDIQYRFYIESNADYQANLFMFNNTVALANMIIKHSIYSYDNNEITGMLLNIYTNGISLSYGYLTMDTPSVSLFAMYHFMFSRIMALRHVKKIDKALLDQNIKDILVCLSNKPLDIAFRYDDNGYIDMNSVMDIINDDDSDLATIKEDGEITSINDPQVAYLCRCMDNVYAKGFESQNQSIIFGPYNDGLLLVLISRDQLNFEGQRGQGFITKGE